MVFLRSLIVLLVTCAAMAAQNAASDEDLLFGDMEVVEAAGMHEQSLRDAPANVTIITDAEIRTYGYRTLGEALSSARGFYFSSDHAYQYGGLRGFNLPGDVGTRWQLMINGHYVHDDIYEQSDVFGLDFGIDMNLIRRIEIIRGPCSALYGANAIFAIINVVTKRPSEMEKARVTVETGTPGQRKGEVDLSSADARRGEYLISGSVYNDQGERVPIPAYGLVTKPAADAERGYHAFFDFSRGHWRVSAMAVSSEKETPLPWGGAALLNDTGNNDIDQRRFVEAVWSGTLGAGELTWRNSWDWYSYRGREDYAYAGGTVEDLDLAQGSWLTSRLTYRYRRLPIGTLTLGGEGSADLYAWQRNYFVSPMVWNLNVATPGRRGGILAQDEIDLSRRWKAVLAARVDFSNDQKPMASPRLALLYDVSRKTVWKLIAGRSFRDPNAFEQNYAGRLGLVGAPQLMPETAATAEVDLERTLGPRWTLVADAYGYRMKNPIELIPVSGGYQYENTGRATSVGMEFEADGRISHSIETALSMAIQTARQDQLGRLPNSPLLVGAWRAAFPAAQGHLSIAAGVHYMSQRLTIYGNPLRPVFLPEITIGTRRPVRGMDFQFGIRNLLNWRYNDPVLVDPRVDQLEAAGRSLFFRAGWGTHE